MSLIVVHLRWDDVDQDQYAELCRALPDGAERPAGCLLRQRRRQGRAVLGTEVWTDERVAGAFYAGLPALLGPAGLREPRQVVFAVPDCFAAGYGVRPAGARPPVAAPVAAAAAVVPAPRSAEDDPVGASRLQPSG